MSRANKTRFTNDHSLPKSKTMRAFPRFYCCKVLSQLLKDQGKHRLLQQ